MSDAPSLFSFEPHVDQRTVHANTLVVTLGSYTDAGHTQRLIDETLLDSLPNHPLGRFDTDLIYDYTGHRPQIVFDRDHYTNYRKPEIVLHHLTDASAEPFLLLRGPEPNLQWERVAATINDLIEQFDIRLTILAQSFPAPAPHTRPTFISQYSSNPQLRDPARSVPVSFQLSSSFTGLLAVRMGEADHDTVGLLAHVPQYLTGTDHPDSAIALLDAVSQVSSLKLPSENLVLPARLTRAQLDAQTAQDEETSAVVAQLEQQYDAFVHQHSITGSQPDVPSAEEIGAEVEEFLKGLDDKGK